MKHIFTLLILFSFAITHAQYNEGTAFFKDSTKLKGLIKIKGFGGIKYKTTKDADPITYDYNSVTGFEVDGDTYRYIKHQEGFAARLLKENLTGKIYLYSNEVYNPGHSIPNGFGGAGGMMFGGGSSTIYFLLIKDKITRVGAKLKKKHLELFKDCPSLIKKIENKDLKRRNVYDIVKYYNTNCE